MVSRVAAALVVAVAGTAAALPAPAQSLQRLTVRSFVLSSDTLAPRADAPFHLTLSLHVREPVAEIRNVDLPMLAELELLGDERQTNAGPQGALYQETITLVAHQSGEIVISPATLEAIDARDGRAKEWSSNGLTLHVRGEPHAAVEEALAATLSIARVGFSVMLWAAGAVAIAFVLAGVIRRRPPAADALPVATVGEPRSTADDLADALASLRATPTRATALAVRAIVWRMMGAEDGETLDDVLVRPQTSAPDIRALLVALERAAFTYESDLGAAIAGACAALERTLGRMQ